MKLILISFYILLFANIIVAQEKTLKYYSSDWAELSKNNGEYVREIQSIDDSTFIIHDYLRKKMKLIMKANCKSINPFIENGVVEYYDLDGNLMMAGEYKNGQQTGKWIINNYFQIEHAELDYNFNVQYQSEFVQDNGNHTVNDLKSEGFPEFPGGQVALGRYFSNYAVYPYKFHLRELNVKTVIGFVIDKEGFVTNPVIIKPSEFADYDKELIRLIINMPRWKPGTQNNKPVDVSYTVPMNYQFTNISNL